MKLTKSEIRHLLTLLARNREDGVHTRPESQYWQRATRIEMKLKKAAQ